MSIVWTTWKLTLWRYRYRELLAIGFFFVVGLAAVAHAGQFDPEARLRIFFGPLYIVLIMYFFFLSGLLPGVHAHERELTGRPMSFCLPGYRQSLRRLSFTAALPWGLFFALVEVPFLWRRGPLPHLGSPAISDACLCLGGASLVGVAVGWAAGTSRLVLSRLQWGIVALACSPLVVISIGVWLLADIHRPSFWVAAGLVAMIVIVFLWFRLGDMRYVARGHRIIIEDALDKRAQVGVKRATPRWVEGLFLSRMQRGDGLDASLYPWGALYRSLAPVLAQRSWILILVAGAVLLFGYGPKSLAETMFIAFGLIPIFVDLPLKFDILLPEGRREKYRAAVAVILATSLLLMAAAAVVIGLSWCLAPFMPVVFGAAYAGIDPRMVFFVCLVTPWGFIARLLGRAGRLNRSELGLLFGVFVVLLTFEGDPEVYQRIGIPQAALFAFIFVLGVALLLLILPLLCERCDLVRQNQRQLD